MAWKMPKVLLLLIFLIIGWFPEKAFSAPPPDAGEADVEETSGEETSALLPVGASTDRTMVLDLLSLPVFEVGRVQSMIQKQPKNEGDHGFLSSFMEKCGTAVNQFKPGHRFLAAFVGFLLLFKGGEVTAAENGNESAIVCPTMDQLAGFSQHHQFHQYKDPSVTSPFVDQGIGSKIIFIQQQQIRQEALRVIFGESPHPSMEAFSHEKIGEIFHQITMTTGWDELKIGELLQHAPYQIKHKNEWFGKATPPTTTLELGIKFLEKLCGQDCFHDLRLDLPDFGANAMSRKPTPGSSDLERSLRPYLLQMNRKLGIGRLWVDNPVPGYKNGFKIGYVINAALLYKHKFVWHFNNFKRFSPFEFVDVSYFQFMPESKISEFKHYLEFKLTNDLSSVQNPNGRRKGKHVVYIDGKTLSSEDLMNAVLLKALCEECADGMKAEYGTKQEKYLPESLKPFARLNAAYAAENYYIRGYNYNILLDVPKNIEAFDRCQGTTFWTDYPNCQTGKYEIPVFMEADIDGIIRRRLTDIFAVFAERTPLQFVPQVQMPQDKFFVHVHWSSEMWLTSSQVGHSHPLPYCYSGEKMSLAKGLDKMSPKVLDYVLYHELLHVVGLRHENQRADAGKHITLDFEGIADPRNEVEWSK